MTLTQITFVSEPARLPHVPGAIGPERFDRFLAAVEQHAGFPVGRVHGFLRDVAPAAGFILLDASADPEMVLDELPPEQRSELASRLVPIGVGQTRIFERVLENLSVPAAVDGLSLFEWETADPAAPGARGLHGLRDIGQLVGASCLLFESARYCYLTSPVHHGLPHLLVDYLGALTRHRG
jgi:hypothetical protein